jgi:phosphatidylglycerol lysyltransferase
MPAPPAEPRPDPERARPVVLAHGWNTTAYQILNPGFHHWFSARGDAVAGLVPRPGLWVVGGAPIAAPARLSDAVEELEHAAALAGAAVCYVGAQDRLARHCLHDPRYSAAVLGAEPWWVPETWSAILAGRASLRAQLSRARNKGVTARVLAAGAPPDGLERVLAEWLAGRGLPPLGFLTTPWVLGDLRDRRLAVAEREGRPVGFLVLTPIPGREGWLVEQIVRGHAAPNGTAELLVDAAFTWMAARQAPFATLGLAPLAVPPGAAALPEPAWWLRGALAWLRAHGRRFYNFEGLRAFKAKLAPAGWDPVYALLNRPRISPLAMLRVGEAVVGGNTLAFVARMVARAARSEVRSLLG